MAESTIFAVSSGQGRAAVAVVRLSGPEAGMALQALSGRELPKPRRATLRRIRDPASGEALDDALVLWMPGPASFTGEDCVELQGHGGLAVRAAVLRALAAQPGCRPAEPGEFTRRAFLNGRLDLTAVEGLADLIDAETEAQRRQALRLQGGALAAAAAGWREGLVALLADVEAALDFADEEDVPPDVAASWRDRAARLEGEIAAALAGAARGERIREGFTVVIAGAPNAGKSTLLNAIAGRDVAIVSATPGTTRDSIEVRCDLGGLPVSFVDTAGLRESEDEIEREGIRRALERAGQADLVLWLTPVGEPMAPSPDLSAPVLAVTTKADLGGGSEAADWPVSARTGAGLELLLAAVRARLEGEAPDGSDALVTRERHRGCLLQVQAALGRAREAGPETGLELVAEDLRAALHGLGRLTGRIDVEEVLGHIFAQFCIGK